MLFFAVAVSVGRVSHGLTTAIPTGTCTRITTSSEPCSPSRLGTNTRTAMSNIPNGHINGGAADFQQVTAKNVLGGPLELCCNSPKTGFYRDGFCNTSEQDLGVHTVCARVTQEFLDYSRSRGNDLMAPSPQFGFPGLKEGDGWCLCASRWMEAVLAGKPCPIVLASTHEKTLEIVPLELLREHAIDRDAPVQT